jgi:DNA repair exonuclease SbcCD ATPase subunit
MAKKPEPFRFGSMTKAELIRTVKALDKRQTKLLNRIAELERAGEERCPGCGNPIRGSHICTAFPWEQPK